MPLPPLKVEWLRPPMVEVRRGLAGKHRRSQCRRVGLCGRVCLGLASENGNVTNMKASPAASNCCRPTHSFSQKVPWGTAGSFGWPLTQSKITKRSAAFLSLSRIFGPKRRCNNKAPPIVIHQSPTCWHQTERDVHGPDHTSSSLH